MEINICISSQEVTVTWFEICKGHEEVIGSLSFSCYACNCNHPWIHVSFCAKWFRMNIWVKLDVQYYWRMSFFNIENALLSRSAIQEMAKSGSLKKKNGNHRFHPPRVSVSERKPRRFWSWLMASSNSFTSQVVESWCIHISFCIIHRTCMFFGYIMYRL